LIGDEIISPNDIHSAGDKAQIGVHELIWVIDAILEKIKLVNQKHLYVIFPTIYILYLVNEVIDLFNERLHPYLLSFPKYFHVC
jgi:hypothetical protein